MILFAVLLVCGVHLSVHSRVRSPQGIQNFKNNSFHLLNAILKTNPVNLAIGITSIVLFIGVPITKIIIGSIYLDGCPAERHLSVYLIFSGLLSKKKTQKIYPKSNF